jgi:hypothetical protein
MSNGEWSMVGKDGTGSGTLPAPKTARFPSPGLHHELLRAAIPADDVRRYTSYAVESMSKTSFTA